MFTFLINLLAHNPIIKHGLFSPHPKWRQYAAIALISLGYAPMFLTTVYILFIWLPLFTIALLDSSIFANAPSLLAEWLFDFVIEDFIFDTLPLLAKAIAYITIFLLLLMQLFFAPAMTVSLIAGERQRQTLDILRVTLLSPSKIIIGKWVTMLPYIVGPSLTIWPLLMLCFAVQGIEAIVVVAALLLLITTGICFSTVGLLASTLAKSITNGMMITYGLFLPLILIAPPLLMLLVLLGMDYIGVGYHTSDQINFYGWSTVATINPIGAGLYSAAYYEETGNMIVLKQPHSLGIPHWGPPDYLLWLHPWLGSPIVMGLMTGLCLRLSIWRMQKIIAE